jgi:hypothetical protein
VHSSNTSNIGVLMHHPTIQLREDRERSTAQTALEPETPTYPSRPKGSHPHVDGLLLSGGGHERPRRPFSRDEFAAVSVSTLPAPSPHLHGEANPPTYHGEGTSPSSLIVRQGGGPRLPRQRPQIGYTTAGQRLRLLAAGPACGDTNSCATNVPLPCSSS